MEQGQQQAFGGQPQSLGKRTWNNFRSLIVIVFFVIGFRSVVAAPYHVPTSSMEPSIKVGDRLVANHLAYHLKIPFTNVVVATWDEPDRGDIIVFDSQTEPGVNLVKRVVGLPGDLVAFRAGVLYINGEPQTQDRHDDDRSVLSDITDDPENKNLYIERLEGMPHWIMRDPRMSHIPMLSDWPSPETAFQIPGDSLFVCGDNRDHSSDSREWGVVPLSSIYGRAEFVLWSMLPLGWDGSVIPQLRWTRFGDSLYSL